MIDCQSLEANLLSRFDFISARNGMMEQLLQETVKSGRPISDDFKAYGDTYFASIGIKKYLEKEEQ